MKMYTESEFQQALAEALWKEQEKAFRRRQTEDFHNPKTYKVGKYVIMKMQDWEWHQDDVKNLMVDIDYAYGRNEYLDLCLTEYREKYGLEGQIKKTVMENGLAEFERVRERFEEKNLKRFDEKDR